MTHRSLPSVLRSVRLATLPADPGTLVARAVKSIFRAFSLIAVCSGEYGWSLPFCLLSDLSPLLSQDRAFGG
jgi:hypothetical protein